MANFGGGRKGGEGGGGGTSGLFATNSLPTQCMKIA